MKLHKVVQKTNTLIALDNLQPVEALRAVLKEHSLKIKDGDYYFIGNRKSTGIVIRNNGFGEY